MLFKYSNMAATRDDTPNLPSIFDEIWKDYQYLDKAEEPTVSDKFQVQNNIFE